MKNLTPEELRCSYGGCPSIHELEDGRLLIIGLDGHEETIKRRIPGADNERAIIIDRALLANVLRGEANAL